MTTFQGGVNLTTFQGGILLPII